ncbi:hypothetical protein BCAR13_310017 [Paraburkholderia caribensis]|nr:hypothetical protein BCAR13_310017 [Paraburkholderia caribensis]
MMAIPESRVMHAASAATARQGCAAACRDRVSRVHVSGGKGLFRCRKHWRGSPVRVKYRAFWNGSTRVPRPDGAPGNAGPAGTQGHGRMAHEADRVRAASGDVEQACGPKQSAAGTGSLFLSA